MLRSLVGSEMCIRDRSTYKEHEIEASPIFCISPDFLTFPNKFRFCVMLRTNFVQPHILFAISPRKNNISARGCLKVWGWHVKYYFCGGKWQNNVWSCTMFVRSITQKRNVGECQKIGETTKYRGKPRSHVLYTSTGRHFGVTVTCLLYTSPSPRDS